MQMLVTIVRGLIGVGLPAVKILKYSLRIWKIIFVAMSLAGTVTAGIWITRFVIEGLPNVNEIYNPPKLSTKIYDRRGRLLYKFYDSEDRSWVSLGKIPPSLIWATIAIEDKDYYNHHGLSGKGMVKALFYDIFKRGSEDKLRGGSTITQQLVKNVFFFNDNSFKRKVKEVILALVVEKKLTKEEILERYFNQVAYGGETYGVAEAALKYFGKDVGEISMAEAAFLAGLPAAPTSYSPYGDNPDLANFRKNHVIDEMVAAGYVSQNKAEELKIEKINIIREKQSIAAPHFVFYVKNYLQSSFGYQNFERQGLIVTTSLDIDQENMAEKVVEEEVNKVKNLRISNGAALVVDPRNGQILAMVGSKNYFASDIDGKYNVTIALRQPGSAIKPINYLAALIKGWTLASVVDDSPVVYQIQGQKPYSPQNYNRKYMGRVTLRTALASSLNIPSVKILASDGVDGMIDLAEKMGITSWQERGRFGLALALGSGEVQMTQLATAYSIFADEGKYKELQPVLEVKNYLGEVIYRANTEVKEVIEPKYAYLINSVLSDNEARTPIFGSNSKLKIEGKTVAVKTGTTNNLKDNWCIGWTKEVLVAAWVGNNDSSSMSWVASGISGATPIWNRIMTEELKERADIQWEVPEGVYRAEVCGREEYFVNRTEKSVKCIPAGKKG